MKHWKKSGRSAARLVAASATAIVLHFGATGSCGGNFVPPAAEQLASQPQSAGASRADWADWLEFVMAIHRLEMILSDPTSAPDEESDKSQADAVALAKDQMNRLGQSGLRESLSPAEIDGGFSAVHSARQIMLDHFDSFTDPSWNNYLETLDAVERELDVQATGAA